MLFVSSPGRSDYSTLLGNQQAAAALVSFPQSDAVLKATLRAVGDQSLSLTQLASMVTVDNNLNTQFVTIRVRDSDPGRAALLAREIAQQTIILFQATLTDEARNHFSQNVQKDLNNLAVEIQNQEQELSDIQHHPDSDPAKQANRINTLNVSLSALRQEYGQLIASYANLTNIQSSIQVTLLQDAKVPQRPVGAGAVLAIGFGALVGLVVILGVIIFIEQADDILRTPAKVNKATGLSTLIIVKHLPVLAKQNLQLNGHHRPTEATTKHLSAIAKEATPWPTPLPANGDGDLTGDITERLPRLSATATQLPAAVANPRAREKVSNKFPLLETFLTLAVLLHRASSQPTSNGSNLRSLLITSAEKGDGKTLVALQIARGLARTGVEVVLIDANLSKPHVHKIFGLSNRVGLSLILAADEIDDPTSQLVNNTFAALQETSEPNLTILSSGPVIGSSPEFLLSSRMKAIINQLSQKALVVIDSPAVLTSSEAVILADKSDGILMVVDGRHTTSVKLNRSLEILTRVNTNILGVVLNHADN